MTEPVKNKRRLIAVAVAAVIAAAALIAAYLLPYYMAGSSMPADTQLSLELTDDGLLVKWPPASGCDGYTIAVALPDGDEPLFEASTAENRCTIPYMDGVGELAVTVNTWRGFTRFSGEGVRLGSDPVTVVCDMRVPEVTELRIEPDAEHKAARLMWNCADSAEVWVVDGEERSMLAVSDEGEQTVYFGPDGDFSMPEHGEEYRFEVSALRRGDGYVFRGNTISGASIVRDDLLGYDLAPAVTDEGDNFFTVNWEETKGERYIVRMRADGGDWVIVAAIDKAGERTYSTGRLEPFCTYELSITSVDSVGSLVAGPQELYVTTEASVVYANVWPLMELELYADSARTEQIGTIPAAECCCVIREEDGMFLVRWDDKTGYIDSNFCLINLPDYIGRLCAYDITNSYSSLYMVHEFAIPEVTDTVVAGYENVQLTEDSYLVPLLYPVAQKLIPAAQDALADGYRIKIYDSYRPNMATRSIYDLTLSIIEEPLPDEPFTDTPVEELELPEPADGEAVTYYQLVTNGTYNLGNFLATRGSYHNMGIAMDMTLEDAETGEELEMQTRMHDLSWYSIISRNNANANLLDGYMKAAGFGGLTSEWWHFQDNDTRNELGLNTYMWSGVTPEGWKADGNGWRYCDAEGRYYTGQTITLGETSYTFDGLGYLVEPGEN